MPTEPEAAPALSGRWPTVHADAENTGVVDAAGPRGTGSVRWQVELPDSVVAAPVVADDGTVVACSRDGTVAAYEPDGTRRWRRTTPEGLFAPHANDATPLRIAGDQVILAHPRGELLAFGLTTGTRRWAVGAPRRPHRPAVADGSVVIAGAGEDRRRSIIRSHKLTNGSEQWSEKVDRTIRIGPGVADGVLYLGDIDGLLVARDAADGSDRWRVRLPEEPWISTIPVVFGGEVWVGTLSEGLFAVREGSVRNRVEMGTSTTPVVGDGAVYCGSRRD